MNLNPDQVRRALAASYALRDKGDPAKGLKPVSYTGNAEAHVRVIGEAILQDVPDRNGPEFTDWGRAALLSVLWHHQGASSSIGQPIRFALGKGATEPLTEEEIRAAKSWLACTGKEAR